MHQSIVTRTGKETYVTALIYHVDSDKTERVSLFVPGWHPDPGGRKLLKAVRKRYAGTDTFVIDVYSCRCGYCRYELPLTEFIKYAKIRHVDKENKEYTD